MLTKDELKKKRKKVYQEAKAIRDCDPIYIALKETIKAKRKSQYQALKNKIKLEKKLQKVKKQQEKDAQLMLLVKRASDLESVTED